MPELGYTVGIAHRIFSRSKTHLGLILPVLCIVLFLSILEREWGEGESEAEGLGYLFAGCERAELELEPMNMPVAPSLTVCGN